jgi:hypothetical protein
MLVFAEGGNPENPEKTPEGITARENQQIQLTYNADNFRLKLNQTLEEYLMSSG